MQYDAALFKRPYGVTGVSDDVSDTLHAHVMDLTERLIQRAAAFAANRTRCAKQGDLRRKQTSLQVDDVELAWTSLLKDASN